MPWFRVHGEVTVSAYTLVKADTNQEACRIARDRDVILCPNGPEREGHSATESVIIEAGDGSLSACRAELAEDPGMPDEEEE